MCVCALRSSWFNLSDFDAHKSSAALRPSTKLWFRLPNYIYIINVYASVFVCGGGVNETSLEAFIRPVQSVNTFYPVPPPP